MKLSAITKRISGVFLLLALLVPVLSPVVVQAAEFNTDPSSYGLTIYDIPGGIGGKIAGAVGSQITGLLAFIVKWWLALISWLLYVSAYLFEIAAEISIVKFGTLAGKTGSTTGFVYIGWATMRDICNLFFIFILLWTAIKTILGLGQNTTKAVVNIILAALLINFSMVATRIVIDSGNVLALNFYNAAKGTDEWGISGRVMNALTLANITGIAKAPRSVPTSSITPSTAPAPADESEAATLSFMQVLLQGIGGSLYILATTILFLAFAALLLYRTLILTFLLVTSPYPFLAYAFSGSLGGMGKKWLDQLICQTYWLFLSMLLLLVSFRVLESGKTAMDELADTAGNGFVGSIVFFVISIGFLYASLIVGRELGCSGAGAVAGMAESKFKEYSSRSGAALGRNTVGRAGAKIASMSQASAGKTGLAGVAGRLGMRAGAGAAGAGFGVKGASLTDTRAASAKAKEAQHKELGEVDEADIAREAATRASGAMPAAVVAEQAAARDRHLRAKIAARQAEIQRTGNTGLTMSQFEASVAGQKMNTDHNVANTTAAVQARITESHRASTERAVRAEHVGAAANRQASYEDSLSRGGPLGIATRREPGTRLAPSSNFDALARVRRSAVDESKREARVAGMTARLATLRTKLAGIAGTTPQDDERRDKIESEIYNLEAQLVQASDASAAAKARKAGGGAAPAPTP